MSRAQRGKAKQKRADLRLVGLGLVVTRDGGGIGRKSELAVLPCFLIHAVRRRLRCGERM